MFSVVISYYKKIKYIERCLDSVMNQSFQNFEVILVDDGSNDNVKELLDQKYPKVKLITKKNEGVSIARNTGIAAASFDYIALLDADDDWHFQYLEFMNAVIREHPDAKIIGTHYSVNRDDIPKGSTTLRYRKLEHYFKIAIVNTLFTSSSSVIRKSFFESNQGFNPALRSGQDVDVWFRTVLSGGGVYFIDNTLMFYCQEDTQGVTKLKLNQTIELKDIFLGNIPKNYYPLYDTIDNEEFKVFISKYIYFNLYRYYYSERFHDLAVEILKSKKHSYFLLDLVYKIPLFVGYKLIRKPKFSLLLRNYMKFVFRRILK
ncbi:glycosyltransferase family 2 protein [Flavobacterium terrisoli]|uniref:glycosyltransferase family 2 protein n=1 Tax=Flavobacterium terrisoli TaxID=3242195 RepID=UPI002543346A|nr:glycosyltransferase family A protein [Flavobacterium buctense]